MKEECVNFTEWCVSNFTFANKSNNTLYWRSSILQKYYNDNTVKTIFTTEEMYELFKKSKTIDYPGVRNPIKVLETKKG